MRNLLLIAVAVTSQAVFSAGGIFSWIDESGNLMYGDNPPENVAATSVTPPKLTVLEGFSTRYQQKNDVEDFAEKVIEAKAGVAEKEIIYTQLNVIAPKQGQGVRANDGDVSVAISLSPKLRSGDRIIIHLDGKEVSRSASNFANLTNLDRGEHTLNVSVVNRAANTLISAEAVTFSVLRNSILINEPFNPYKQNVSDDSLNAKNGN